MGTVVAVYRQAPRPANADPEEQEAFKKAPRTAEGGVGGSPGGRGGVVAEDEMCVGLKPVLRRAWAPKGRRPVAKGEGATSGCTSTASSGRELGRPSGC